MQHLHFRARKYYALPMAGFYRNRGHGFKNGFEKLINCYMNIIIIIIIIIIFIQGQPTNSMGSELLEAAWTHQ